MKYTIYASNTADNLPYLESLYDQLEKVPYWIIQDFYDYGGKIGVTENMPEGFENKAGAFKGVFRKDELREGTARIYLNKVIQSDFAVIHEIGHYFYYRYHIYDNKFVFDKDEMIRFVNELCNGNSYFLERKEFFAEAFSMYLQGKLTEEGYPVTVSQLSELWND